MNEEFAAPLKEMLYVATKDVKRISTNGACIYFDPDWLQKLGHTELDFILSHQLMHIALGHIERPKYYKGDRFHLACDIVANSHLELLGWKYDRLPRIGRIFHETFFPAKEGRSLTAQEALDCVPFDPATMEPGVRRNYMIDAETWWDQKEDRGEKGVIVLSPGEEEEETLFCDEDTTGGKHFFVRKELFRQEENIVMDKETSNGGKGRSSSGWDKSAANEIMSLRSTSRQNAKAGNDEDFAERVWQRVNSGKLNWKKLLNRFIQEEVCDYSFTPPDRRWQDSEFFLPNYNVFTERPKEVLFMVDTSSSIDDDMLSTVYGEICNALAQFNGGLVGALGFFDMRVYTPVSFSDVSDLLQIKPRGGGGTDFGCLFDYVQKNLTNDPPVDIVIFTDGQAEFPGEASANNIPVLWLFSDRSVVPPWGKYAYVDATG
ncbi:vWA domain-containing protein [Hominifimenecus sp. rT4P-3]|uniref:vWA domain-containing protein n=1 Tax=Hominifimenecus sp. rT4P-3 TaxID=3242979 RepID=UPI003DA32256